MLEWLKGTMFHEGLHLIGFWWKMNHLSPAQGSIRKITYGSHHRQYFLLVQPKRYMNPKKIVIYFHGGAWTFGSPDIFLKLSNVFTECGFWLILASHRQFPRFGYDDMRQDVDSLMSKVLGITKAQDLDKIPIVLGGMSSGAHLASLFALDADQKGNINFPSSRLHGMFLFGAPLDLDAFKPSPLLYLLSRKRKWYKSHNPIEYLQTNTDLKVFLVQGTKDGLVPICNTHSFIERAEKCQKVSIAKTFEENGSHLDVLKWIFEDNEQRKALLKFIETC